MRRLLLVLIATISPSWADAGDKEKSPADRPLLQVRLVENANPKDGLVIDMIGLSAGEFMMGASPGDEKASPTEEFRHKVRLSRPFYLGKFELTDMQWRFVMGKKPNPEMENHPAAAMNWIEANEFTTVMNKRYASQLPKAWFFACPTSDFGSRSALRCRCLRFPQTRNSDHWSAVIAHVDDPDDYTPRGRIVLFTKDRLEWK